MPELPEVEIVKRSLKNKVNYKKIKKIIENDKEKDSMIRLLIGSILFIIPLGSFADEKQREIENEALNLVIKKYGKGLENSLKGTGVTPSYRRW